MDNKNPSFDVDSILSEFGYKNAKPVSASVTGNPQPSQRPAMPTGAQRPVTPAQQRPAMPTQPQRPVAPAQQRPAMPTQPQRPVAPAQQRPAMPTGAQRPVAPAQQRPTTPTQPQRPVAPAQQRPAMPTQPQRPAAPTQQRPTTPTQPQRPVAPAQQRPATPTQPQRPAAPAQQRPTMPTQPQRPVAPAQQRPAMPTGAQRPAAPAQQRPTIPTQPQRPVAPAQQRPAIPTQPQRPVAPAQQRPTIPTQPQRPVAPAQQNTAIPVPVPVVTVPSQPSTTQPQAAQTVPQNPPVSSGPVEEAAVKKAKKKKKKSLFRRFADNLIIQRGDKPFDIARKSLCFVCIMALVGCICVLFNDFVLVPLNNTGVSSSVEEKLNTPELTAEESNFLGYPSGILNKFRKLYYANQDTVGWINIPSTSPYWHGVNYVVAQADDNDYYLDHDFNGKENKNGTIFLDHRCVSSDDKEPGHHVDILYGHNMRSGQMFASLNQYLSSVEYARSAPIIKYSTLFEENDYKIFAILSADSEEKGSCNFLTPYIENDDLFLSYIAELRLRSWYNFSSVDVNATDELILLYTCSNTYQTTMGKSGRTLVVARKVRKGESSDVDKNSITNNSDKLMPKVWYKNKKKELPAYYTSGESAAAALNKELNG